MSWIDIFLLLVVMAGLAVGYIQGLWRQAMSLGSILIGVILATYLQGFLSGFFGYVSPGTPLVVRQTVAFLLLVGIIAVVLDVGGRRIFPETRLSVLGIFDRVGGLLVGFFTICIQLSAGVLIFKFLASGRVSWPIGESVRLVLAAGVDSSALVPVFFGILLRFVSTIGPMLPEGVPTFLTAF